MTMRSHLEDDVLLDVIEGAASVEAARHARECAQCAGRLADAREGLALAAGAEAPEPSPLFWHGFRRRVAAGIETELPRLRFGRFLTPALLATAATVAVLSFIPRDPALVLVSPAPRALAPVVAEGDEAAVDAAASEDLGCSDVAACVVSLTDEESRALADALRADLAESEDL